LISSTGNSLIEPWLTIPLSTEGPNLELVGVELSDEPEPGKSIRVEITVLNSGESLQDSFNITVYIISNDERELVGIFSQSLMSAGQGITKLAPITVPEDDWTLEVFIDEEHKIWELNEEDNSFSKDYDGPEKFNFGLYTGIGAGIIALIALGTILKRRAGDELLQSPKKMPALDELPRSGPPEASKAKTSPQAKPKKGPPPKQEYVPVNAPVPDITEAMSKLSLDSLPGKSNPQPEKIASFEYLPGGGEYEYLGEGTFYSGESIGRWRLEDDGTFTKLE
jgi:hypothetical protein